MQTVADEDSPSVEACDLWRITAEEAATLVDQRLGPPEDWSASGLLDFRLASDFQRVWKVEVGHWLHTAQRFGFLDEMLKPLFGERDNKPPRKTRARTLDDPLHMKLHEHLASAMTCHYFTGTNWSFNGWETERPGVNGGKYDIDLALNAPNGQLVEFQVKTPTRPANDPHGAEFDRRAKVSLEKAFRQLPENARSVAMVAIFATNRAWSLCGNPRWLLHNLYGHGVPEGGELLLQNANFGRFMRKELNQVAGIVVQDVLFGAYFDPDFNVVDRNQYPCTVLLNPRADLPADPDWFPHARVLTIDGGIFRWVRGEPWEPIHGLPDGTRVHG